MNRISRAFMITDAYKIGEIIPIRGRWKELAKRLAPDGFKVVEIKAGVCVNSWYKREQMFDFTYEEINANSNS